MFMKRMASIMPSGYAGFTTRIRTHNSPMPSPYHHLPVSVNAEETGSVAMYTVPMAHPPRTMCQWKGTANMGLVSEPIQLKRDAITRVPKVTPAIVRHEPTPVPMMSSAPIKHASAEVSPIEPGIRPRNDRIQLASPRTPGVDEACASHVAPEKVSTPRKSAAIQGPSPLMSTGYAKKRKARTTSAGFRKFKPVPPKISLAKTTPNTVPTATCHRGMAGGRIKGMRAPVTKNPSFTSCPLTLANNTSTAIPLAKATRSTGTK